MIEGSPQIGALTIDLHEHFIEVSTPVSETLHPAHALAPNIGCKQRPEAVPPKPHCLVADINSALEKQILHVAQAQREADVHQHRKPDDLG